MRPTTRLQRIVHRVDWWLWHLRQAWRRSPLLILTALILTGLILLVGLAALRHIVDGDRLTRLSTRYDRQLSVLAVSLGSQRTLSTAIEARSTDMGQALADRRRDALPALVDSLRSAARNARETAEHTRAELAAAITLAMVIGSTSPDEERTAQVATLATAAGESATRGAASALQAYETAILLHPLVPRDAGTRRPGQPGDTLLEQHVTRLRSQTARALEELELAVGHMQTAKSHLPEPDAWPSLWSLVHPRVLFESTSPLSVVYQILVGVAGMCLLMVVFAGTYGVARRLLLPTDGKFWESTGAWGRTLITAGVLLPAVIAPVALAAPLAEHLAQDIARRDDASSQDAPRRPAPGAGPRISYDQRDQRVTETTSTMVVDAVAVLDELHLAVREQTERQERALGRLDRAIQAAEVARERALQTRLAAEDARLQSRDSMLRAALESLSTAGLVAADRLYGATASIDTQMVQLVRAAQATRTGVWVDHCRQLHRRQLGLHDRLLARDREHIATTLDRPVRDPSLAALADSTLLGRLCQLPGAGQEPLAGR